MTIARSRQISLEHTRYYHCISRCVRRAFLCGRDRYTGKDFGHRRQWLEKRLKHVSAVFSIDLLAYAIMSNHYHVVIRVNHDEVAAWSDDEVVKRWGRLFRIPAEPVQGWQIEQWRARLSSISWFMRCLNEPMARRANREDDCSGRFWEGRYKLQALLDETALLRCMAYVDLNPVRAGLAKAPKDAAYTSIHARIHRNDQHLMPLRGARGAVPVNHEEYLRLVDASSRILRPGREAPRPGSFEPILYRMRIDRKTWANDMRHYGRWYYRAVGPLEALDRYRMHLGQQWLKGARSRLA